MMSEGLLRLDDTPFVAQTVTSLAASACEPVRGLALVMKLRRAEPGALTELAAQIQSVSKFTFLINKAGSIVFAWRADSVSDIQALGMLATSEVPIGRLRRDAAHALMADHSIAAVPFLAELLGSPD